MTTKTVTATNPISYSEAVKAAQLAVKTYREYELNEADVDRSTFDIPDIVYTIDVLNCFDLEDLRILYILACNSKQRNTVRDVYSRIVKENNADFRRIFIKISAENSIRWFVRHQCIPVARVKATDTDITTYVATSRILPTQVDSYLRREKSDRKTICADAEYFAYVRMFADNLALFAGAALSEKDAPAKVSHLRMGTGKDGKIRVYDFTGHTFKDLSRQLDALFMLILGKDTKVHPTAALTRFVIFAGIDDKRNVDGVVRIDAERAVLGNIMNAIAVRMSEKAIVVETGVKSKAEKPSATEQKAEEAISKTTPAVPNALTGGAEEGAKELADAQATANSARVTGVNAGQKSADASEKLSA